MDSKLNKLKESIESWCEEHNIPISILCDTSGLQGIKIYEKNKHKLRGLFENIYQYLATDDLHMDVMKVRGGSVVALSIKALSENDRERCLSGEIIEHMSFEDKIDHAFSAPIKPVAKEATRKLSLAEQAKQIAENQYKTGVRGATRANQGGRNRNKYSMTATHGGIIRKNRGADDPKKFDEDRSLFASHLQEALAGLATPTNDQPSDLFAKFGEALKTLGTQMGVGPLQSQLKAQGINWKKSDDGLAIILYIINANTNAAQPIARINAETLTKPHDFQKQLLNMLDFSRGEAPGAFEQQKAELQAKEKAAREITNQLMPQPSQGMGNAGTAAAAEAAAPKSY
jgi:hypothetical protein